MRYHSHIHGAPGIPVYGLTPFMRDFYKGQKLGGFVVPDNISDNIVGLFYQFFLWQSSLGICEKGKDHIPVRSGYSSVLTETPVLSGDSIWGRMVCESVCDYLPDSGLWSCQIVYGGLPWCSSEADE